jgi:hypothetical protein
MAGARRARAAPRTSEARVVTPLPFARRYDDGLRTFVFERSERSLRTAYELGREAVQSDMSVLNLVALHNASVVRALQEADSPDFVSFVESSGEFLVESLAAFEMMQRGLTDAQRAAFRERRTVRMLRQLSTVLADVSVAAGDPESVQETVQLVAEHVRELAGADRAVVTVATSPGLPETTGVAEGEDLDTWSEVLGAGVEDIATATDPVAQVDTIRSALVASQGEEIGFVEVVASRRIFSDDERGVLTQIAQMTAAALQRVSVRGT